MSKQGKEKNKSCVCFLNYLSHIVQTIKPACEDVIFLWVSQMNLAQIGVLLSYRSFPKKTGFFKKKKKEIKRWGHTQSRETTLAFADMEPQKLIFRLDIENMPEHISISWFTMLQQDSVWFNPRFNLLGQMNFRNLFQTQCHSSACGPSVSVSGSTNMSEKEIYNEYQETFQIISPEKHPQTTGAALPLTSILPIITANYKASVLYCVFYFPFSASFPGNKICRCNSQCY